MALAPLPECATGKCPAAIDRLEALICRRPHDYTAHYQLGVCYAGLCRKHPLVSPALAAAYLRHSLTLAGEQWGARAAILDQLGHTLLQLSDDAGLREAIARHSEAAALYQTLGLAEEASRAEYNLGNSCCELSEATGEDHWREAILHYRAALASRSRRAAVLTNMATAYRHVNDLANCIRCYRQALATRTVRENPDKRVALENNLGNAFLSLPDADEKLAARNARRALRHFDRALNLSQDSHGRLFGITQYNRAQAYLRLEPRMACGCLQAAEAAFQSCGDRTYSKLIRIQLESLADLNVTHPAR